MYVFQKNLANGVESWECEQRRRNKCKAELKLQNDQIIGRVNDHTHAPNQSKIEVTKLRASMKRRVETTLDTPQRILSECLAQAYAEAAVNTPRMENVRRTIYGDIEQKTEILPILATGLTFRYYQMSSKRPTMMNAFSSMTVELVTLTASSFFLPISALACWSSLTTGLLTVSPVCFYQVYTIHAMALDKVVPCVYALPRTNIQRHTIVFSKKFRII